MYSYTGRVREGDQSAPCGGEAAPEVLDGPAHLTLVLHVP